MKNIIKLILYPHSQLSPFFYISAKCRKITINRQKCLLNYMEILQSCNTECTEGDCDITLIKN